MKTLLDHLAQYDSYHRDARNVATHYLGIPMITVAVFILLSRVRWMLGEVPLSPALLLALGSGFFYLRLDVRLGVVMAVIMAGLVWLGHGVAAQATAVWLGWGAGLFVVGWLLQLLGHYFEGRKPAFVDDLAGLLIGPLFVVVKLAFAVRLCSDVQAALQQRGRAL